MFIRKSEFIKAIHNVRKESHLLGFKDGKDFVMSVVKIHNNNHKKEAYCVMKCIKNSKVPGFKRSPVSSDMMLDDALQLCNKANQQLASDTEHYEIQVF